MKGFRKSIVYYKTSQHPKLTHYFNQIRDWDTSYGSWLQKLLVYSFRYDSDVRKFLFFIIFPFVPQMHHNHYNEFYKRRFFCKFGRGSLWTLMNFLSLLRLRNFRFEPTMTLLNFSKKVLTEEMVNHLTVCCSLVSEKVSCCFNIFQLILKFFTLSVITLKIRFKG